MSPATRSLMEPAPAKIRILIVDDQLVIREGLRMLIEDHPNMKVVAMASTCAEALEIIARESLDLVILDLELSGHIALSSIPELCEASSAQILALTGARDAETHQKAAELGAMGVVLKKDAADSLLKAIEKVYRGEAWFDRLTVGNLLRHLSRHDKEQTDPQLKKISSLTDRERQVVALIAEGLKNRQIASRLFISPTTVTHHLSSIYSKLDVSDRLELVVYAFANNLTKLPE